MITAADHALMARALVLAAKGVASTDPNPAVGCLIVKHGEVRGEGFTRPAGGNHAEIEALNAAGDQAAGATVYVSLEPCAHTGRTGPCTAALIGAGVARVVYAIEDPNPAVAGQGLAQLRAAGIEVEGPLLAAEAGRINRGFFSRMQRGRPWVCCKMAASLDGRTALANGASQWITGADARADVHRWRARSSAVMTGIGTVLADDPRLNARADDLDIDVLQPLRIVVDSKLRMPADAAMLSVPGDVIVFTGDESGDDTARRREQLEAAGARIECVSASPRLDLAAVLARLGELEINTVWLEAGPILAGAMLAAGVVDELVLYLAPCLLGTDARGLFELPALERLDDRYALAIVSMRQIGPDIRICATTEGSATYV